jgi:hypothetical protein
MARPLFTQKLAKQVVRKQDLEPDKVDFALTYLSYYFHNPADGSLTEDKIGDYVKEFQSYTGMVADGELDAQVIKAMQFMPRCGCKDYSLVTIQAAGKPAWGPKEITYYVEKWVDGLSQQDQSDLIQMAFNAWSQYANIRAKRISSPTGANVIISTGQGAADQFDGPSGTLAWAYLPPQANFTGQLLMRFDLDETWITKVSDRGILYLNVATHEFGHLLGLEHSKEPKALMAPYYNVAILKPQQVDDIPRIVDLYGKATQPPPVNPPSGPGTAGKIKVEIMVNSMDDIKISGKDLMDFSLI